MKQNKRISKQQKAGGTEIEMLRSEFSKYRHYAVSLFAKSPNKQCNAGSWLLNSVGSHVAPLIATMYNKSFSDCVFPDLHKKAVVRPLLKKPNLDACNLSSYRPLSNLSFISKTPEQLVSRQFVKHSDEQGLFTATQSAYRENYSTETALVHLHDDMVTAIDHGDVGALVLLNLSAAFETADHTILIDVLR